MGSQLHLVIVGGAQAIKIDHDGHVIGFGVVGEKLNDGVHITYHAPASVSK